MLVRIIVCRSPDDGGGAVAAPSGAAAIATAAAAAAGSVGAQVKPETPPAAAAASPAAAPEGKAPSWSKPDWLPDHLAGATPDEALEKTFKAFDGFRQKASARGEVPKDAAGYAYVPPDDLKSYFTENDPGLAILSGVAHKLGLSKGEYETLAGGFVAEAVKQGLVPKPFDPQAELAAIGKGLNLPATREGKAELAKIVGETSAFAESLGVQLGLAEGPKAMLAALADTADGLLALNALRGRMGSRGPQIEGAQIGSGAVSKDDLKAMSSDPRIDPYAPQYDPRLREKYDADCRKVYGV